jgi:8-oxo-dGTP pyrophosphatase MutT (NUDIX family)
MVKIYIMNMKNRLHDFVSIYKGIIIEVLIKGASNEKSKEVARCSPGVRAITITDDNKFIITRKRREYLGKEIDYRLPGGNVVDTLLEYHKMIESKHLMSYIRFAVSKELTEETGIKAKSVTPYAVSNSGRIIDWDIHYFEMKDLLFSKACPGDDDETEVLQLSVRDTIDIVLLKQMSEDRSRIILLDYLWEHYPMEVVQRITELKKNNS